jgi:hypothetical protein
MGGLSKVAQARLEELIAAIELPPDEKRRTVTGKLVKPAQARRPAEGTWIEREYKGAVYRVKILDRGVELDGVPFRSLSALAKKITGSHWNGPAFFGLTPRSKPKPKVTP